MSVDAQSVHVAPKLAKSGSIHPYSAALLILLDNAFFGANAVTLGLGTLPLAFLAFVVTTTGVFLTQRFLIEEATGPSLARGFFLGVVAGIPTSFFGTGAGAALLARAGLARLLKS